MNNISVYINNNNSNHISINEIAIPAMNYGQAWRYEGYVHIEINLKIERADFLRCIKPWFEQFRSECKADQEFDNDEENDIYVKFKKAGFPSLHEMPQNALLEKIILECQLEILQQILPKLESKPMYLINKIVSATISDNVILQVIAFKNQKVVPTTSTD